MIADYVEAPSKALVEPVQHSIFLAGGISGCPDWQTHAISQLSHLPVRIYNPRRRQFVEHFDKHHTREQIEWEFKALKASDIVLFWFPYESICPITLYELGRFNTMHSEKHIIIGAHPQYSRREDIVIQTQLAAGHEVTIHDNLDTLLKHAKMLLTSSLVTK